MSSKEVVPDIPTRLRVQYLVLNCDMNAVVECFVEPFNAIRGQEEQPFVVLNKAEEDCQANGQNTKNISENGER